MNIENIIILCLSLIIYKLISNYGIKNTDLYWYRCNYWAISFRKLEISNIFNNNYRRVGKC